MRAHPIVRSKTVVGLATPAFIENGSHFFVNLLVFADGLVDCWELVDLALFKQKLEKGWVVTRVPDGQELSIHGLGSLIIEQGTWELDAETMYQRVESLVRQLNPRMENLHDCHGRTVELVGKCQHSILGMAHEQPAQFEEPGGTLGRFVRGERLSVFLHDGDYHLVDLRVFADGKLQLGHTESPETIELESLHKAVKEKRIVSSVPKGSTVRIHGIGAFVVRKQEWKVNIKDMLLEIPDLVDELNGRPGSIKRCRNAYKTYIASPSAELCEELRIAYEAVPKHNRMYVGDMDTKDIPVRMIIYGDKEIEGWTHRAVARGLGMALPELKVPRPKKKPG